MSLLEDVCNGTRNENNEIALIGSGVHSASVLPDCVPHILEVDKSAMYSAKAHLQKPWVVNQ